MWLSDGEETEITPTRIHQHWYCSQSAEACDRPDHWLLTLHVRQEVGAVAAHCPLIMHPSCQMVRVDASSPLKNMQLSES